MVQRHLFTSESVAEGHPDKVSDQVSDAVLDAIIAKDKNARVDCETLIMQGTVMVTGQITTTTYVSIPQIVRGVLKDIGFNNAKDGLDWETCGVLVSIEEQSPDISMGVNRHNEEMGAGDQGCLRKGTLVRTERGFVPIEDVLAGDKVVTHLGLRTVTASRKTGEKKLVGITLENGMHLECTPDHRILCYDKGGSTYWRAAGRLTAEDFVCTMKPTEDFPSDHNRSHVERSQFFTKYNHGDYGPEDLALTESEGYVLGETIGDGNLTKRNYISIEFGDNFMLSLTGFESYRAFLSTVGFSDPEKARRAGLSAEYYSGMPRNSRGLYLVPHPTKKVRVDETRLGVKLPFAVSRFKERVELETDEVFDIEVQGLNIFSANGIFVHNSVFGYASNETPQLMPLPIMLAHGIVKRLADTRKQRVLPYLRPDGKSQVTVEYVDGKPQRVEAVVVAAQHNESVDENQVRQDVIDSVVREVVPKGLLDDDTKFHVNSTGRFVIGGTLADSGLTGRKIIVDTYGGVGAHGGGCLSGKDSSKVDRSGSYMARYIAKNIVAAGLADKCQTQISYAIGVARPVSFMVDTFGTGKVSDERITDAVDKVFDMRPGHIISDLDLLRPIYRKTACYGHFGREDPDFTWERTDRTEALREKLR